MNRFLLMSLCVLTVLVLSSCTTTNHADGAPPAKGSITHKQKIRLHLRHSDERIRTALLNHTPLGSSPEEVLAFIQERLVSRDSDTKPTYDTKRGAGGYGTGKPYVGVRSIRVELGWYRNYFHLDATLVYADWAFNAENQLVDIVVYRMVDGP